MNNINKTAVEWLIDNLKPIYQDIDKYKLLIRLAKDMERVQIIAAAHTGFECGNDIANKVSPEYLSATEYYNETYDIHTEESED